MDPDEVLRKMRAAIAAASSATAGDGFDQAMLDAVDAAEALDEWLSGGGYLPAAWNINRRK